MLRKACLAWAISIAIILCAGAPIQAFASEGPDNSLNVRSTQAQDQDHPALHAQVSAVSASSASSAPSSSKKTAHVKKPTKKQLAAFKKASADFSIELFRRSVAAQGRNANVTVAPLSIMSAMAITANGASGKTGKQMRKALGNGASMARINKNLSWYNSKLTNTKRAKLSNANSIWYHNDGTIIPKKGFLDKTASYYGAETTAADFSSGKTVDDINRWVSDNTNGMIRSIVDRLSPRDRIAIVNALYFDAKWKEPFDATLTKKQEFTNAKGAKSKVKMMHSTEHKFISGKNVTGFIKSYAKGYSYVALLPKKGLPLKKYVASLTGTKFRKLVSGAIRANVIVSLPKQSLTYSNDAMEKQLSAMGMKTAFSPKRADFSKMASDATGKLHIGQVVHKTRVDVDEVGTKAAAVTGVFMKSGAIRLGDVKRVILNRPFVYAIVDNATKLPVFIGAVNNLR